MNPVKKISPPSLVIEIINGSVNLPDLSKILIKGVLSQKDPWLLVEEMWSTFPSHVRAKTQPNDLLKALIHDWDEIWGLSPQAIPTVTKPVDLRNITIPSSPRAPVARVTPGGLKPPPPHVNTYNADDTLVRFVKEYHLRHPTPAPPASIWPNVRATLNNPAMAKFLKVGGNVAMLGFEVWNIMNAEDKAKATFQATHAVPACILGSMMTAAVPNLYGKLVGAIASVAACSAAGISADALSGMFYDEVNSQVLE